VCSSFRWQNRQHYKLETICSAIEGETENAITGKHMQCNQKGRNPSAFRSHSNTSARYDFCDFFTKRIRRYYSKKSAQKSQRVSQHHQLPVHAEYQDSMAHSNCASSKQHRLFLHIYIHQERRHEMRISVFQ
jgi:hypothetical protein